MKSFLIVLGLCSALVACSSDDEGPQETKDYVTDQPSYTGGEGSYYNPCGRTYVLEFPLPDGGVLRKEVPVYCNPNADEYHGYPPDYQGHSWDEQINPPYFQLDYNASNAR